MFNNRMPLYRKRSLPLILIYQNLLSILNRKKLRTTFSCSAANIFSGLTDLGHTDLVQHTINLEDDKPFKEPYRNTPPYLIQEVCEHLREMIEIGAIRESSSPYSSNVVIIRKKRWHHPVLYTENLIHEPSVMRMPSRG